jgi:hypothetical protein
MERSCSKKIFIAKRYRYEKNIKKNLNIRILKKRRTGG